jgi:hypothetical protein
MNVEKGVDKWINVIHMSTNIYYRLFYPNTINKLYTNYYPLIKTLTRIVYVESFH